MTVGNRRVGLENELLMKYLQTFQCTCRRGYVGDGEVCADLNECLTHRHDCSDNEACINTDGGFFCKASKKKQRAIGQACYDGTHTCDKMATCVPGTAF